MNNFFKKIKEKIEQSTLFLNEPLGKFQTKKWFEENFNGFCKLDYNILPSEAQITIIELDILFTGKIHLIYDNDKLIKTDYFCFDEIETVR
jgi:hypothetical protein